MIVNIHINRSEGFLGESLSCSTMAKCMDIKLGGKGIEIWQFFCYWTNTGTINWEMCKISKDHLYWEVILLVLPDWMSQASWCPLLNEHFNPFSLGFLVSSCIQCSGGLRYWKEDCNAFLVCFTLAFLQNWEKCINLAEDQGQSDG